MITYLSHFLAWDSISAILDILYQDLHVYIESWVYGSKIENDIFIGMYMITIGKMIIRDNNERLNEEEGHNIAHKIGLA